MQGMQKQEQKENHMKNIARELYEDYLHSRKQLPDLENITPPLINVDDVLRAHYLISDYFSKTEEGILCGVRSPDLLYSAVSRQIVGTGNDMKYSNPLDICATLFFGLVKNHAFHDGNKRTALLILLYQLTLYGRMVKCKASKIERLTLDVASTNFQDPEYRDLWDPQRYACSKELKEKNTDNAVRIISEFLRKNTEKRTFRYRSVTYKELISALECYGYIVETGNGSLQVYEMTKNIWGKPKKVLRAASSFHGENREVRPKRLRKLMDDLGLSEEYPNYNDFFSGDEPMSKLIAVYEGPLKRLKDK